MAPRDVKRDETQETVRAAKEAAAKSIRDAKVQAQQATAAAIRDAKLQAHEATAEAKREVRDAIREAKREARDAKLEAQLEAHRAIHDAAQAAREATGSLDISAALEAAWGRVAAARRGPRPTLTLARIVEEAVALADRDGVAAVSMNALAAALGTKPMSLYRYVDSKEQLLELMLDAAVGQPTAGPPDEPWRAGLTRWAWSVLASYEAHPWASEVPTGGPPDTPNSIAWLEDALHSLRDTSLPLGERMSVVLILSGYVRASATLNAQLFAGAVARGDDLDHEMRAYSARLRHLAAPERFPRLHEVLDAGVLDRADPPHEEFAFGLDRVLDGIAARIADTDGRTSP